MTIQKPLSGTETEHKRALNIQDTINCVQIASDNLKKGEFRVFNQFTEFSSLNEWQKNKEF